MAAGDDDARPVTDGGSVGDMSYTDASQELDEIVRFFEQREIDVDQLVTRLVRATAIVEELDKRLRRTRVQVEQLVPKLAAVLSEAPDAGEDDVPGADAAGDGSGPEPANPKPASPEPASPEPANAEPAGVSARRRVAAGSKTASTENQELF
jgi:exodeoxyribonuclease VII small subunit